MVNFKASSHAGAHARSLAGGEKETRKLDKLAISQQHGHADDLAALVLKVQCVEIEPSGGADARPIKTCVVSPEAYARLAQGAGGLAAPRSGALYVRRPGSDCVLTARASAAVDAGAIALTEVQCRNLRVCAHEQYAWERFEPDAAAGALGGLLLEAWLLNPADSSAEAPLELDAHALCVQLRRELFGHVICAAEILALALRGQPFERANGVRLVLRVTDVLPDRSREPAAADDEGESVAPPHVWRGVVSAETLMLVSRLEPPLSSGALDGHRQLSTRFELRGADDARARIDALRAAPRKGEVRLVCNDGEWFPAHASLLKPCIALNRAVRHALGARAADAPGDVLHLHIAVDTLSLDKVLLHLEAAVRAHEAPLDIATAEQLRPVGTKLGYRALVEQCDRVLGDFAARLRVFSWAEVVEHNARGGCWIVMDGMVLDVERWLPEHPGGEHIIPQQVRRAQRSAARGARSPRRAAAHSPATLSLIHI